MIEECGSGVTIDQFVERYPRLFHMAALDSWTSIRRHGLLSTSALLDLFEIDGVLRSSLESCHRPASVPVEHSVHGRAVIRDQKPMDDTGLRTALGKDFSPREWYELLNEKVFFWPTRQRLEKMLNARAYKNQRHLVLTLDSKTLLTEHECVALLSPINSGCTKPYPHPRSKNLFQPLRNYPFQERLSRGLSPCAEVAIPHSVPDVERFVLRATEEGGGCISAAAPT